MYMRWAYDVDKIKNMEGAFHVYGLRQRNYQYTLDNRNERAHMVHRERRSPSFIMFLI